MIKSDSVLHLPQQRDLVNYQVLVAGVNQPYEIQIHNNFNDLLTEDQILYCFDILNFIPEFISLTNKIYQLDINLKQLAVRFEFDNQANYQPIVFEDSTSDNCQLIINCYGRLLIRGLSDIYLTNPDLSIETEEVVSHYNLLFNLILSLNKWLTREGLLKPNPNRISFSKLDLYNFLAITQLNQDESHHVFSQTKQLSQAMAQLPNQAQASHKITSAEKIVSAYLAAVFPYTIKEMDPEDKTIFLNSNLLRNLEFNYQCLVNGRAPLTH